jgi:hypothetical protein
MTQCPVSGWMILDNLFFIPQSILSTPFLSINGMEVYKFFLEKELIIFRIWKFSLTIEVSLGPICSFKSQPLWKIM